MRPLLITDGAHLKGTYKGTNLVLVGMDGNNQIVPIATAVGRTMGCTDCSKLALGWFRKTTLYSTYQELESTTASLKRSGQTRQESNIHINLDGHSQEYEVAYTNNYVRSQEYEASYISNNYVRSQEYEAAYISNNYVRSQEYEAAYINNYVRSQEYGAAYNSMGSQEYGATCNIMDGRSLYAYNRTHGSSFESSKKTFYTTVDALEEAVRQHNLTAEEKQNFTFKLKRKYFLILNGIEMKFISTVDALKNKIRRCGQAIWKGYNMVKSFETTRVKDQSTFGEFGEIYFSRWRIHWTSFKEVIDISSDEIGQKCKSLALLEGEPRVKDYVCITRGDDDVQTVETGVTTFKLSQADWLEGTGLKRLMNRNWSTLQLHGKIKVLVSPKNPVLLGQPTWNRVPCGHDDVKGFNTRLFWSTQVGKGEIRVEEESGEGEATVVVVWCGEKNGGKRSYLSGGDGYGAEEASSIWPNDRMLRSSASESIMRFLSRMLHGSIDVDVTINTGEGASKAH
ncbi:hypothetical protein Tco_0583832 [Tanacetum coccineum]